MSGVCSELKQGGKESSHYGSVARNQEIMRTLSIYQEEKQIVPWSACFITSLSPQHQEASGLVTNNSQLEENATTDCVWRDAIVTAW